MTDDGSHELGRRTFLKATGAAGAAAAVGVTNVTAGREPGPKENEIVVGLYGSASVQTAEVEIQQSIPESADVVHRNDSLGYLAVAVPESASSQARDRVKRQLRSRDDVKFVEKNKTYEALNSNDPRLDDQYAPQQVRALAAWEKTYGNDNIELGIIDNGAGWGHENLQARFDENNPGVDFAGSGTPDPSGDQHGTHVAGIASASTDNGTGTAGISNSRMYSLKALSSWGGGSLTDIADAIDWSAQQGLDVINMSLGGAGSSLLRQACSNAYSEGVLIIAAAGNDGAPDSVNAPAIYDECMAVSALNSSEDIAGFSSRGPEVEIAGPGANVLSTDANNSYTRLSGTSMASPAVAGVASLGLEWAAEQGADYSNDEMRALLKETARDVGLSGNEQGSGCANADALLEAIGPSGPTGELTFDDQFLGDDGAVTVSEVSAGQPSAIVVTYPDGDENIIAGLDTVGEVDDATVDVAIEDAGGFPGEHTAWIFDADDVPSGVGIGDDATPVAPAALDSDTASVTEPDEGLTFSDQLLGDDGAVTVSNVVSNQASTVVVTYPDGDQNIIAGLGAADDLDGADVDVTVEDAGGFPGEHTAWLLADADLPDVGVGDDATPVAGDAIDSDTAVVSDEPQGPEAVIDASTAEPAVGEEVELDGTDSTSPNGEIVEYRWNAEPGGAVTSPTAVLTRDEEVAVDVTLTVEDEDGETGSTTQTFEFEDDASCGEESAGGSADGTISWWNRRDRYSYGLRTDDPCQLTVDLDGPTDADFDLYVTLDGRRPSPRDYDRASETPDGNEQIVIDDPSDLDQIGILVQGVSGWGSYTISAEELSF